MPADKKECIRSNAHHLHPTRKNYTQQQQQQQRLLSASDQSPLMPPYIETRALPITEPRQMLKYISKAGHQGFLKK